MSANPVTGGGTVTVTQAAPMPLPPPFILMATAFARGDHRAAVALRLGDQVQIVFADGAAEFGRKILAAVAQAKALEGALRDRELVAKLLDGPTRDAYQAGWQSYGRVLTERGQQ